ncbi:MAG: hypothetical protein Q9162_002278 [Coniocarpon cinnabarinum]
MPKPAKRKLADSPSASTSLVIDNGAYEIKAGFAAKEHADGEASVIPNCIARGSDGPRGTKVYVGEQLKTCKDFAEMSFRRPVEKGYIVNWDSEMDIWRQSLFNQGAQLQCEPHDTSLILTEAPNCPQALQANTDQIIFEELEFDSAYRCIGPTLNYYNDLSSVFGNASTQSPEGMLVIDSGYSHTTITPLIYGRPVQHAIRRLDVGGRVLTNRLKELISLRQFNLMDDTHLVNEIKEDTCFVSQDFGSDLEQCHRLGKGTDMSRPLLTMGQPVVSDYVLPNYHSTFRGRVRQHEPKSVTARLAAKTSLGEQGAAEDACTLGNERFVVPEIVFAPSDIGMSQAGLAETVVQSLRCLPAALWPALLTHVLVIGGTCRMPGFVERFESDLRSVAPSECPVRVRKPADPVTFTWSGGMRLAQDHDALKSHLISRGEYLEHGSQWTAKRFMQTT